MPNGVPWTEEHIDTLISMYLDNASARDMGKALGRKPETVRAMLSVIRRKRNLPPRKAVRYNAKTVLTAEDIEYRGPVERGHWLITKPWGRYEKTPKV